MHTSSCRDGTQGLPGLAAVPLGASGRTVQPVLGQVHKIPQALVLRVVCPVYSHVPSLGGSKPQRLLGRVKRGGRGSMVTRDITAGAPAEDRGCGLGCGLQRGQREIQRTWY